MTTLDSASSQPVPIANSELRQIRSTIIGQDYLVKVRLPETYADSTTTYPVLYLLDGDHAFAMATDIVQYLIYGEHIPDLIIVSPAYGSKDGPDEGGTNLRDRDLVPFPTPWTDMTPGGERYLEFLQQELIPSMESLYRIDPTNRTLWGYSLGALFVLYALFQRPEFFKRYIVIDGFHDTLVEIEETYATQNNTLPAKLFLSSGGDEGDDFARFQETLKSRNYDGFELEYMQLNDLGHFAVGADGLTKGLIAVFRA